MITPDDLISMIEVPKSSRDWPGPPLNRPRKVTPMNTKPMTQTATISRPKNSLPRSNAVTAPSTRPEPLTRRISQRTAVIVSVLFVAIVFSLVAFWLTTTTGSKPAQTVRPPAAVQPAHALPLAPSVYERRLNGPR
jgi:hypothetical protein